MFKHTSELAERFRNLSEQLSSLIEEEGWSVLPYLSSSLVYFRQLSVEQMQVAVRQVGDYIQICQRTRADGESVKSSLSLVKKALEYYSFTMDSGAMDLINDSMVVEFYNLNHLQMFRTFNFFEKSSYCIEDLYCRPWYALYDREPWVTEKVMELGMKAVNAEECRPTKLAIDEHFLTERASLQRLRARVKGMWIAPLFQKDVKAGFINIVDAQILGTLVDTKS